MELKSKQKLNITVSNYVMNYNGGTFFYAASFKRECSIATAVRVYLRKRGEEKNTKFPGLITTIIASIRT